MPSREKSSKLHLEKPVMILVSGVIGSGKSQFAMEFSESLNLPLVSTEKLATKIFENPNLRQIQNKKLSGLAVYCLSEMLKTGSSVIVDGLCTTLAERRSLYKLASEHDYDSTVVWVQTDVFSAKQRSLKIWKSELSETQVDKLINSFVPPEKENHVVISGKHIFPTQAKTVLRKLTENRAKQASKSLQMSIADRKTSGR